MIVPPGSSSPSRSAASIIAMAGRSLTLPPGLSISSLASTSQRASGDGSPHPHQRRVPYEVEDGVGDLHGPQATGPIPDPRYRPARRSTTGAIASAELPINEM